MNKLYLALSILIVLQFIGCNEKEEPTPDLDIPSTYAFVRDDLSTVDYSGQTARLDMLSELKTYIGTANNGATLDKQLLLDLYANENNPFSSEALNQSDKQLENKTFLSDIAFYKDILSSAAEASISELAASSGQSGLTERGPDRDILVNEKGWEYTQFIEKGLMGAVFLHQIYNVYLSDEGVGNAVENEVPEDGENYTAMEHHWDEAFGYWGVPLDFDSEGENRFWGNYTNGREGVLGGATKLKEAFLTGRAAIVAKAYDIRDEQKAIIYQQFELTAAATAVHYINECIADLNNGEQGSLLHHASEGYGFVRALKYSPSKAIADEQINTILNSNFGIDGNFWSITLNGLQTAKSTLTSAYPSIAEIADDL